MAQLVHLTHGIVKDGRNDAPVGVARRPGVAFAQAEAADEAVALFIVGELQAHAFGIVLAAGEAVILLQAGVMGIVALGSLWHRVKGIKPQRTRWYTKEPLRGKTRPSNTASATAVNLTGNLVDHSAVVCASESGRSVKITVGIDCQAAIGNSAIGAFEAIQHGFLSRSVDFEYDAEV